MSTSDEKFPLIQRMANSFIVEEIGDNELEIRIRIPKSEDSLFLCKLQELQTNMREIEESRINFFNTERGKAIPFLTRLGTIRGYKSMIADIYELSPDIAQSVARIEMEKGPDNMQVHVFATGGQGSVRKYSFAKFMVALDKARKLLLGTVPQDK